MSVRETGALKLAQAWRENLCSDAQCEEERLQAALLVLHGAQVHVDKARLVLSSEDTPVKPKAPGNAGTA